MKQSKITGIVGTVVLHVVALFLLFVITLSLPEKEEEGGVPVMLGNTDMAKGTADPYMMTEVDVLSQPETVQPEMVEPEMEEPVPGPEVEQPLITQDDEAPMQVKKEEPKAEKPKNEQPKKKKPKKKTQKEQSKKEQKRLVTKVEPVKPKEKTEAEKRAEAEAKRAREVAERAAAAKAAEEAAAKAAANKIAGAFGKGTQMGSKGNAQQGSGIEGRKNGNSNQGGLRGAGGYGTFDLNGRSLGTGGLPIPVYNVQDEGRVVVTIVVNPSGKVISTSINKRTNTVNPKLRKAAEEAARKARFNAVSGVNNQSGTITYYFKLK